jgi:hypothetical protein
MCVTSVSNNYDSNCSNTKNIGPQKLDNLGSHPI